MTEVEKIIINKKEILLYRDIETGLYRFSKDAVEILLQAFEEIQQYRAIGTVEEFKALKEKEERFDRNIKMFNEIGLEIRNKALDEFAEALKEKADGMFRQKYVDVRDIDEIAEQLKGVQ